MKKNFILFSVFFYITFLFSKPLDLEVNAKSAILINADNKRVLFEKNANQKTYPASITKMLISWYVTEKYLNNLNDFLIASETALRVVKPEVKISSNYGLAPYILETDGKSFDILLDEKLTLRDLLYGMLVHSGNDASNVVAENLGSGSIENFMKDVNEYLKFKGCFNTYLCNPHGLHMPDHVSTAYDIALATSFALKNSKFLEIFSCKYCVRPKTNKQTKKEIVTFNKLLRPGKNYYKYAIGAKTGYHAKAKYNMLTVAKKNDRTLVAVVLGCSSEDQRCEDTIRLFETAFEEKKITKKIFDNEKVFLAKINGGAKLLKAGVKNDLYIEYYPAEKTFIRADILWNNIKAPIKKGQKVANILIKTEDNQVLKVESIYALNDVRRTLFFTLKELFKKK
jgi:D-alanyl-D-alanine carboxypeptidase (penicillin-binding protein 5/6)